MSSRESASSRHHLSVLGCVSTAAALSALTLVSPAGAQAPTPPTSPSVTVGGNIQADYEAATVADTTRDRAFFRRLMLSVQVVATKDWTGQMQIDVAPSLQGDRVVVRDAYLRYLGWTPRGLAVTIGNQKLPFSRLALISASRRGLIERTAPGERPFGTPGRALAVQVEGRHRDQHVQWAGALASALHGPDVREIRVDGLAESRETWNEGVLGAGRVEWHPLGNTPRDQGDFGRGPLRVVVGTGAYRWQNDGDRNLFTTGGEATSAVFADADQAQGVEISGGLRGHGFSLDASWQRTAARTLDAGFTGGIYQDGDAALHVTGVESGYMAIPGTLEILGGFDTVDIAARPALAYRPSIGANWYVNQHRLKFQLTHREAFNVLGVRGVRGRTTTLQAQLYF